MAFLAKQVSTQLIGDPFDFNTSLTVLNLAGALYTIGTPTVNVKRLNNLGFVLEAHYAGTPTNSDAGYSTGCLFVNTNGGTATTLYLNEGSSTSATWVALSASSGGGGGGLSIPFSETDSITTTGASIGDSATALTTGAIFQGTVATGVFTTGGSVFKAVMNAVTTGQAFTATTTGVYTGTGLITLTANSATTGTGIAVSMTGLTTGAGVTVTGGTSMTTGALFNAALGASTSGAAFAATTTGVYTDSTTGIVSITANSLTTGSIGIISATGQTSGTLLSVTGGGANLTTGIMLDLEMGAAIAGTALKVLTSGVYAGSNNAVLVSANSATTTTGIVSITGTGLTTGVGLLVTGGGANLTTGKVISVAMGAATAGNGVAISSTGIYATGSSGLLNVTANSATTTTGLAQVSATGLTSGSAVLVTSGGANMTSGGKALEVAMGAATTGNGVTITSTGVYTPAAGNALLNVVANSATTPQGGLVQISGTGLTTGVLFKAIATAATLTTGFYFAANDSALNVLTIGANGHITSNQTTTPTIATNSTGLSAVAVTAGSTDVCGTITSTGTPASGTVITLTFHKTYTVAPKVCIYTPANAAAGGVNTMPIVTTTATTAVFTWPAAGVYAATPSWTYCVIA